MYKNILKFIPYFAISTAILIFFFRFKNQHIIGIDEFKYIDWSINLFNEKAVLDYFRPFFFLITNLSSRVFDVSIHGLKAPNVLCFFLSIILLISINKKYLGVNFLSILPLIFFLFNPNIQREFSLLNPFALSYILILLNIYLIFKILEENPKKLFFFLLGIVNILCLFTREELILIFIINIIFFFKKKYKLNIIQFYLIGLVLTLIPFVIFFFNNLNIDSVISITLNIVDKEISSPLRNYYYEISNYNILDFLIIIPNNLKRLFSDFFLFKEILIFVFVYYFFIKKKIDSKTKYLLILLFIFFFFYFYIRVNSRLFILFEVYFIMLISIELQKINFEKKLNLYIFNSIIILILSLSILNNLFKDKYNYVISLNELLYREISLKHKIHDKIFILPTAVSLVHKPQKYFNNKPSENFSMSSEIFFGENVYFLNEIISSKEIHLKEYINDLNIKFIVFENHKNNDLLFKKKDFEKITTLLKINKHEINEFIDFELSDHIYLKKYGGRTEDYFAISIQTFNKLIVDNLMIEKIFFFKDGSFQKVNKYQNKDGIYLIFL